jgi:hypothetical protein
MTPISSKSIEHYRRRLAGLDNRRYGTTADPAALRSLQVIVRRIGLTHGDWELLEQQGAREIWVKTIETPDGDEVAQYKGEEYVEVLGERRKVDNVEVFDSETEALAWLNGGVE